MSYAASPALAIANAPPNLPAPLSALLAPDLAKFLSEPSLLDFAALAVELAPASSADALDFVALEPTVPAPAPNTPKPDAPLIAPVNALKPPFTTSDITMAVNKLIITLNPPETISSIVKLLPNISSISADKLPKIPPSNKPDVAVFMLVMIESIKPPSLPPC